jgi:2-dehydropantoate 2-reductase
MNILIIGAGAVGLVYGQHFSNAGHQVTFFVKEKYQRPLEQDRKNGVVLYHLNKDKALKKPIRFQDFQVISSWDDANHFDVIALAISSNALRQLPLEIIKRKLKLQTSLLMLQPSQADFKHLSQVIPENQILQGMISLISYQTDDINTSAKPSGTAYYLPPLPMPISATNSIEQKIPRAHIVNLFNNSGIKAKAVDSAVEESRLPSAFLMTFLCALEAADWKFDQLRNSPELLSQLSKAQQALLPHQFSSQQPSQTETKQGLFLQLKKDLLSSLLKPWLYKLLLRIAPIFVPLPLEAYLKKHFLKVRPQTMMYMKEYEEQHPSAAITNLLSSVR